MAEKRWIEPDRPVKKRILAFIYQKKETSKQEIGRALSLSMPTVLQNVNELAEDHFIREAGEYESTGGRRAKVLAVEPSIFETAGLDITTHHVHIAVLDACGALKKLKRIRLDFKDTPMYYKNIALAVREVIGADAAKIYGIGISLPGIIDAKQHMLVRSHILGVAQMNLRQFQEVFQMPVLFINDANSAACAELRDFCGNAVYISLSDSVGGAIYMNKGIYMGERFKSGEFGHMTVAPGGRQCYCGKQGCFDAYCSAKVLKAAGGGSLDTFFERLEAGDAVCREIFATYTDYLAIEINNLRMAFDCDIMLGGYAGRYMEPYHTMISEKAAQRNPFAFDASYLRIGRCGDEAAAVGAALQPIDQYYIEKL